jgi:3-oxoadipate CoA-transferase, beta subunit
MTAVTQGWSPDEIARRVYRDLPEGSYVNLGIGLPTRVLAAAGGGRKEVVFHSENGILGLGPPPGDGQADPDMIDAGKNLATLAEGGCFFSHVESFAMIRGGHVSIAVLGAYEVSASGDLANWSLERNGQDHGIPAVGGAVDLAAGVGAIFVMMNNLLRHKTQRLVGRCELPITGLQAVTRIYTDIGILAPAGGQFRVVELADNVGLADVHRCVSPDLVLGPAHP